MATTVAFIGNLTRTHISSDEFVIQFKKEASKVIDGGISTYKAKKLANAYADALKTFLGEGSKTKIDPKTPSHVLLRVSLPGIGSVATYHVPPRSFFNINTGVTDLSDSRRDIKLAPYKATLDFVQEVKE